MNLLGLCDRIFRKSSSSLESLVNRLRGDGRHSGVLLGLVLFPNGLLRERLRLAEGLVQCDDALSEM